MMPGEEARAPVGQRPPGDFCPICGKKYLEEKKKYMRMSAERWIAVAFILVISALIIFGTASLYVQANRVVEKQTHTDVMIISGGYYAEPLSSYSTRTTYSITVSAANGSKIDAYIMTGDQYLQAYQLNNTTQSFAALESHENINQAQFTFVLDQSMGGFMMMYGQVYLVLDNRDFQLTPGDAAPQGDVSVSLDIVASYRPFASD
ncbi:MAG: hypothetical protein HZB92_01835 [Euryarchaeota archaeon]|nr:hypothetical protein [Euryarchaeota archaeon]